MILCFVFGGYFILNYAIQFQTSYFRPSFPEFEDRNTSFSGIENNTSMNQRIEVPRFNQFYAPDRLIYLLGGFMFIVAGITIWYMMREKEIKDIEEKLTDTFLLPEEREIISELKKTNYESTQSELVRKTGFSKVKVHRILNKLEKRGIVKRHEYGMTKKVLLKQDIHTSKK